MNLKRCATLLTLSSNKVRLVITKKLTLLIETINRMLWRTINEVWGKKSKLSFVKTLEISRKTLTDNSHISEAFNKHFSEVGSKLVESIESDETMKSFHKYVPCTDKVFTIAPICSTRVLELLLKLSDNKATGLDGISSKLLKIAAPIITTSITDLFNCSPC